MVWALENCWFSAHGREAVPFQVKAQHKFVVKTRRNIVRVRVRLREEEQGGRRVINEVPKRINLAAKVCDLRSKLSSCVGLEQKQRPTKGDILNFAKFT